MTAELQPEVFLGGKITQWCGDVRVVLSKLPENYFDCVVTSPPYWGLRDYGMVGQLGLERNLGEHLAVMVDVFAAVRRVLKPSGTLWLNYGDCYATSPNGRSAADTKVAGNDDRTFRDKPFSTVGAIYDREGGQVPDNKNRKARAGATDNRGNKAADHGGRVRTVSGGHLKPKDLCMVSNRLAIALQENGWWVRSEIIWHKPNPMPESIADRPTSSHEKIWLLTKAERYFFNAEAIAEFASSAGDTRHLRTDNTQIERERVKSKQDGYGWRHEGFNSRYFTGNKQAETRNARNVWTIPTSPFPEAHFATFPPGLAERCIRAGCPAGGEVFDPFGGAGTTALVAASLGCHATLIELNPEYCRLSRARIEVAYMGKTEGQMHMVKSLGQIADPGPLFAGPHE
jgi:DNA modification methylase